MRWLSLLIFSSCLGPTASEADLHCGSLEQEVGGGSATLSGVISWQEAVADGEELSVELIDLEAGQPFALDSTLPTCGAGLAYYELSSVPEGIFRLTILLEGEVVFTEDLLEVVAGEVVDDLDVEL